MLFFNLINNIYYIFTFFVWKLFKNKYINIWKELIILKFILFNNFKL